MGTSANAASPTLAATPMSRRLCREAQGAQLFHAQALVVPGRGQCVRGQIEVHFSHPPVRPPAPLLTVLTPSPRVHCQPGGPQPGTPSASCPVRLERCGICQPRHRRMQAMHAYVAEDGGAWYHRQAATSLAGCCLVASLFVCVSDTPETWTCFVSHLLIHGWAICG